MPTLSQMRIPPPTDSGNVIGICIMNAELIRRCAGDDGNRQGLDMNEGLC